MSRRSVVALFAALVVVGLVATSSVAVVGATSRPVPAATSAIPVSGSLSGPTVVSTGSSSVFRVYGYGGPAISANGSAIGNITYYATPVGPNVTGVDFTPSSTTVVTPASTNVTNRTSIVANLVAGNASETISIDVMISSTYKGQNESTNISFSVTIVQPYVVSATIVNPSNFTVSAFTVYVTLDGNVIGSVNVSSLIAGGTYKVTYKYATLGLSSGDHTFTLSLVQEHGLVTFTNGATVYSETVYVTGPPPNYTLWYIAGTVAFFGAIFIFLTRVAARRRGQARR